MPTIDFIKVNSNLPLASIFIPGEVKKRLFEDMTQDIALYLDLDNERILDKLNIIISENLQKFSNRSYGAIQYEDN